MQQHKVSFSDGMLTKALLICDYLYLLICLGQTCKVVLTLCDVMPHLDTCLQAAVFTRKC